MPNRICPVCSQPSIPVSELLVSNARCPNCHSAVGVHWLFGSVFFVIIFAVAAISTFLVLARFGVFAAILWFSFPIGAIGYLKARFSPLQRKNSTPIP